jgi:DNA-binding PadR family transcriptional regulator
MSSDLNPTAASILGVLTRGPMTGGDVIARIELTVGHFWSTTRSQVYSELKRLEEARLVTMGPAGARGMRVCTLTAAGERAFREWLSEEPPLEMIRFPLALSIAFQDFLDRDRLLSFVRTHREAHRERLARYREYEDKTRDCDPPLHGAVRLGVRYEQAILDWLDEMETTLASSRARAKRPAPAKPARPTRPGGGSRGRGGRAS